GIASTGVPTEQSTRPPGTASATERSSRKRSCGYGGGTNPGAAMNRRLPGPVRRSGGCAAAFAVPHDELAEAADTRLGDSGTDAGLLVTVHFDEHVTFAMERGDDVAPFVRHGELDDRVERPQSGGEDLDQLVRETPHKPDGVAEQRDLAAGELQATCRGIERREQAVLDEGVGVRQPVQEGRLAGVRVADERDRRELTAPAGLALGGPGLGEALELALELVHASLDAPPVDLELGLARAAGPDAAGLLAELDAATPEAPGR